MSLPWPYECRFSPSGARVLYRANCAVAKNLRTTADVERAVQRDLARLRLARMNLPPCSPRWAWRAVRAALGAFPLLDAGTRYRLTREKLGRLRDLEDTRQLTLLGDDA